MTQIKLNHNQLYQLKPEMTSNAKVRNHYIILFYYWKNYNKNSSDFSRSLKWANISSKKQLCQCLVNKNVNQKKESTIPSTPTAGSTGWLVQPTSPVRIYQSFTRLWGHFDPS